MDEWLANLIVQVPIAIAILLVLNRMDKRQSLLDIQREETRAASDQIQAVRDTEQSKVVTTLLQTAISSGQNVAVMAEKIDNLTDYTSHISVGITEGFSKAENVAQVISQQSESRAATIAESIISANEAAMLKHEARILAAIKEMEGRLTGCLHGKQEAQDGLYRDLLAKLEEVKVMVTQDPDKKSETDVQ